MSDLRSTLKSALVRLRLWYYHQRARIEYGPVWNVKNALYCLKLAWHFLCGRLLFITTEQRETKGGYKCISLVISKRPMSNRHTYEDL